MEDTFDILLDDTFPEMYKNDNLKKKNIEHLNAKGFQPDQICIF